MKKFVGKVMRIPKSVSEHHVGAYAAQSAYFFILSMIPIILLMLTMVQYTPVTKADVMTAVLQVFPKSFDTLITSIVNQVYNQSSTIIPITIVVAMWSAGKGVLAMTTGLNNIYHVPETRNYFYLRIRATKYTLLFLIVIISLLLLSVFGNSINYFVTTNIPVIKPVADVVIETRRIVVPFVMTGFSVLIYVFLPNRRDFLTKQIPGAVFSAIGWLIISWVFSIYLDIFTGFSSMYGSLTTIVLIMLWLYFCMYCILLGAEMNVFFFGNEVEKYGQPRANKLKENIETVALDELDDDVAYQELDQEFIDLDD